MEVRTDATTSRIAQLVAAASSTSSRSDAWGGLSHNTVKTVSRQRGHVVLRRQPFGVMPAASRHDDQRLTSEVNKRPSLVPRLWRQTAVAERPNKRPPPKRAPADIPTERPHDERAESIEYLGDELRAVLEALTPDPSYRADLHERLLDISEYAVDRLSEGRRNHLVPEPVAVLAPPNAMGWSAGYGWIFQHYELTDAADDGQIVFAVEHGKADGIKGDAPLAAVLRVDRTVQGFKQRVLSGLTCHSSRTRLCP